MYQNFTAILKLKSTTTWMLNTMDKSELELLLNPSVLYSIQDHQIFGCPQKNADYHLLAIFTNTSIVIKAPAMFLMVPNSTSPMDQVLLQDSSDKIQSVWLEFMPTMLFLVKLQPLLVHFYHNIGISFLASRFDGILGMAWPSISIDHCPLIFDLLYKQGQVDGNSFSFYLTKKAGQDGSALVFGGIDTRYAAEDFKYYNLKMQNYWFLEMEDIVFNGTSYKTGSNLGAIIDTGTSVIAGPTKVVEEMTAGFGPGKQKQVDCSTLPTLPNFEVKFGSDTFVLKPEDYILQITQGKQTECIVGIIGLNLPAQLGEAFILGDSFIKTYYTHFDVENARVGFARAK